MAASTCRSHASHEPAGVRLASEEGIRSAYTAHSAELYRFALGKLADEGRASDTVQEVFLRAWRAANRFDPEIATLRVWLFTIARNVVIDEIRRHANRPVSLLESTRLAAVAPAIADGAEQIVISGLVTDTLNRLSAEHRMALVETYLYERPYTEVARRRGIPVGTLRSRVFYGLRASRLLLHSVGAQP